MQTKNLCENCPDGVRGFCCFYNVIIEGFNLILSNQHCKYLDTKTMKCKDYENRVKIQPYCLENDMFNKGALPKGCLYIKGHPEREENPKVDIKEVVYELSTQSIMEYNVWNNVANIEQFALKNED